MHRSLLLIVVLMATSLAAVPAVRAQATGEGTRYSFESRERPLQEALEAFIAKTRIGVMYNSALVAGKTTSCVIEQALPDDLLRCILEGSELTFEKLPGGTYALKQKEAGAHCPGC